MKLKLLPLLIILLLGSAANAWDQINIQFTQQPGTPYFAGQPSINIDGEEFTTVVLKIKSAASGTARLFWATNFDPKMNEPKSLAFSYDRSNDFKEYVFNLKRQNPYWAGFIGQLLFLPENGPAGLELAPAQAMPGNFFTDVRSGWREFFQYEPILARTVNIIKGPQLNGDPINFYLYVLILLAFALALINELVRPTNWTL